MIGLFSLPLRISLFVGLHDRARWKLWTYLTRLLTGA